MKYKLFCKYQCPRSKVQSPRPYLVKSTSANPSPNPEFDTQPMPQAPSPKPQAPSPKPQGPHPPKSPCPKPQPKPHSKLQEPQYPRFQVQADGSRFKVHGSKRGSAGPRRVCNNYSNIMPHASTSIVNALLQTTFET